jgi:hypothetical protein
MVSENNCMNCKYMSYSSYMLFYCRMKNKFMREVKENCPNFTRR